MEIKEGIIFENFSGNLFIVEKIVTRRDYPRMVTIRNLTTPWHGTFEEYRIHMWIKKFLTEEESFTVMIGL